MVILGCARGNQSTKGYGMNGCGMNFYFCSCFCHRTFYHVTRCWLPILMVWLFLGNSWFAVAQEPTLAEATDWPWWRGPHCNGVASAGQRPPVSWSATENVLWKCPVPGHGHGSPILVGDQIFLATCYKDAQVVLCIDAETGTQTWKEVIHQGGLVPGGNQKRSQAASTLACDGERLFVNFHNRDAIYTTALDRDGTQIWQTKISDYVLHQGYGSSPAVFGPLVLVSADHKGGGAIAALERTTGDVVWRHDRPETANYTSPIVLSVAGRRQLVFTGCDRVSSFDPLTGKSLWEIEGATTECVTSVVADGDLVFSSGGYPKNHIAAVRADGSGERVWENSVRAYVPSLLVKDGFLYAVTDAGVAMCFDSQTGDLQWKGRLGGTFSASPVLVDETIFAVNESGKTFVFEATPDQFTLIGENQLGDEVFATPVFCRNRIYMRVAMGHGEERQEMLFCLGETESR